MSISKEQFILFVTQFRLEIIVTLAVLFVLIFLVRSFRRSLLIERGQAKFVLEHFDVGTDRLHKWLTFFVFFLLVPLFVYVEFTAS